MAAQAKDKKTGKQAPLSRTPSESAAPAKQGAVRGLRLCLLRKWANFKGYGFDLNVDPNVQEHFIARVDIDSPAELGGVRKDDRIIEVNGLPVDDKSHLELVDLIKREPKKVQLLVIDAETDKEFSNRQEKPSSHSAGLVRLRSPTEQPKSNAREARQQLAAAKASAADFRFAIEDSTSTNQNVRVEEPKRDKASKALKPARSAKPTKPAAKGGKISGACSPVGVPSMSKAEAQLHRKYEEARAQLESDEGASATQVQSDPVSPTFVSPTQSRRHSLEPMVESLPQGSDGSAPGPPGSPTFPPPYYPSDQYYYGGFAEGPALDAVDQPWSGMVPFTPEYGAASMPYGPPSTPSLSGAYSAYQPPGLFWSPPMAPLMPYQAPPFMPIMPLPFYGYPGSYAPGYSDFAPLYSGYTNYPVFPYAGADTYGQPAQEANGASSPPPQAVAVRAPLRRGADAARGRRGGGRAASGQQAPAAHRQGQNPGSF